MVLIMFLEKQSPLDEAVIKEREQHLSQSVSIKYLKIKKVAKVVLSGALVVCVCVWLRSLYYVLQPLYANFQLKSHNIFEYL